MSNKLGNDFVHYTADGIFFYDSSSILTPGTSQSSLPQITQITCSADFGNNIATTGSLSGYFVLPLMTGSPDATNQIESQLNVVYNTGSFFAVSSSNESFHYNPTSSTDIINYNLFVEIEKNDSSNLVASKTYSALTGSIIYSGVIGTDGNAMGYNYISASLTGSAITIFNVFSQSIHPVFISASGFTSNILQSGSYGSGSFVNYLAPAGTLLLESSSLVIARDAEDTTQSSFIFRVQSGSFGGSNHRDFLYISASVNKVGFNTTNPQKDLDFRGNEIQFQKETSRTGILINDEGNIESFDLTSGSFTTGSEIILKYSRGITIDDLMVNKIVGSGTVVASLGNSSASVFFNALKPTLQEDILRKAESLGFINPPVKGDTLGQIRWTAESGSTGAFNKRQQGETAVIKAVVSDTSVDGIQADLIFSVATKGAGANQKFLIDALDQHQITGSLEISDDLTVGDDLFVNDFARIDALRVGTTSTDPGDGNLHIEGAITNVTNITSIGNTAFGNAVSDTHTFTGDITASAGISASGNVSVTGTLRADGNVDFNGDLDVDGTTNLDVVNVDGTFTMANNTKITGDNTAGAAQDIAVVNLSNRVIIGNTNTGVTVQASAANLILDSAGDITIDADSGNVYFKDATVIRTVIDTSTGNVSASQYTNQVIPIVQNSCRQNAPTANNLNIGNSTFGWNDRAWDANYTPAAMVSNFNPNANANCAVFVTHKLKNLRLIGSMKHSSGDNVSSFWLFKLPSYTTTGGAGGAPQPVFIASGSSLDETGASFHTVNITGSAMVNAGLNPGDGLIVAAQTSTGGGNIKMTYTVTGELDE